MLVFRSITIGLLGACLYLLGSLHQVPRESPFHDLPRIELAKEVTSFKGSEPVGHNVTVIDVAPGLPATTIASLVRLNDGERIVTVGDHHVGNDLAAGMEIADVVRRGDQLLDLTVGGVGVGVRRVLVVRH